MKHFDDTPFVELPAPSGEPYWEQEEIDTAGVLPEQVWTVVEEDDGEEQKLFILPGYHLVNKLGYIVTEQLWDDTDTEYDWT